MNRRGRVIAPLLAGLGSLLLQPFAHALSPEAQDIIRTYPQIPGLAGRVLNQEEKYWLRESAMPSFPDGYPERDPDVLEFRDRQGNPISREQFIEESRPSGIGP